ncbi:Krba1 [Phodopus roborovskii]|uniref:Krba1 protein n=2 Tax=Phodopus roborovskii TaxID=109678 RepID=A0AAV0A4Z6_PHORO|nr:Krba1 [Phodopus roborovskii]
MRENYETLVSVGTSELLPLSAFLSPTEPGGTTAGESHHDKGQEPPLEHGSQGGQPQQSLHLTALVQLVKEIPEFLFGEVKGTEDYSESGSTSLDGEQASPEVAGTVETYPPRSLLNSLPESPESHPSLATTPTGSSSSSGPPGDWAQESSLPTRTADKPLTIEKEGLGASRETSIHPTQSLDQSKSHLRQDRGTSPENSPLQGLINCLKEILVPGPQHQHRGTAPDLPPSLPGLSVLKQTRAEVEPGSLPCPVKTEAISGDCPLQGLLNCLKEIPEAPDRRPSPSGVGDLQLQADPGKRNSGGMRCPQTPPLRRSHGAGSMLAMVKVEDSWAQSPPVPASCQLSRQGHSPYFTGDNREIRVPRWGPMMTLAGRASSSPLEALEACLKGIPPGGSSPLQSLATSWSRSPQPGDAGSQRLELQPQGSHSEEATREPLLPLSLQGCMREGLGVQPSGSQGTPTSFSSASSSDGDLDFGSPRSSQGQRLGKGYPPGNSPLQGLENCLREIPIPRPQAAWPCSLAADRGLKKTEPRNWTADREGPKSEACEPPHFRQGQEEVPSRSLRLSSTQTCPPTYHQVAARPRMWQWPKDETATMPSPLHCLESSLRGILPVRPLRFTCVTGPGPSPSPCSSSSFSSSDGEDLRPETALWQPALQKKDYLPSGKGPEPLSPVSGASPRGSKNSHLAEDPKTTEPGDCSSLSTGKTERTGAKSQSPRREGTAEHTCHPGPVSSDEGKGEASGCPWPASQLEKRPETKGTEESRDQEPGHKQPGAIARTQGNLLSEDPLETPSKSPLPIAALSKWPPTSFQSPCPCGRSLQQELHSLGTALTDKLDQLAAALAGLTQEVATMRTRMDRMERHPRSLGPKGQASWQLALPRRPRWANRLDHRHPPYQRQKGPTRPKPKILRAQAEGCKAGDCPGLPRGKGTLVPQLPPDASLVDSSRPTCSLSQQISAPGGHNVLTAHPLVEHTGCHQNPLSPSVPTALVPLVASPETSADTEPQAARVAAISSPNQHREPNSLLGGALSKDLWGGDHRDPRWGAH